MLYQTGWTGRNCDLDVNECNVRHFCSHGNCTNSAGSFQCTCPPSVYGLKCQLDEDECQLEPCNGGECVNKIGSYDCHCRSGTSGKNCESLIGNTCHGIQCNNRGNCKISNGKPICHCNHEYVGTDCSVRDFCLANLCLNGSTCVNDESGYTCKCPKWLSGKFCEQANYCASSPAKIQVFV